MPNLPNLWGHKMRQCLRLMGRGSQKFIIGLTMIVLGSSANAQGLRLTIQQIWAGLGTARQNPYYANIENLGPNDEARLSTGGNENHNSIEYPIEVPTGSHKRIIFLSGGYNDGKVYLRYSGGTKEATIRSNYNPEQTRFGLISDNPSDLIFMKGQAVSGPGSPTSETAIGIGGCLPDDAPDRSLGYNCLDAVVLGDGTEKLRDSQIRAIKIYVQSGGSLVFVGGAAQSASSDSRWQDLLPVAYLSVVTKGGLTQRIGTSRPGSMPLKVAKGSCTIRSYGAGIVSMISVNPFESPIRESEDRKSIMARAVRSNHSQALQHLLMDQIGDHDIDRYSYGGSATYSAMAIKSAATSRISFSSTAVDPFQIKPPSVENIMWILIIYAIVVVPINFLILRKMNKLEVAWISTPVISVAFSMILLNSTIGLYKANGSTRTTAIAILGDKSAESLIFGRSEMFFPRSKSYNLELSDVESIIAHESFRSNDSSGMNLIDDGQHVIAPQVETGNLAFKELTFVQTTKELQGMKISLVNSDGKSSIRIVNQSHSNLSSIVLVGPGIQKEIKTPVPIGGSVMIPADGIIRSKADAKQDSSVTGWQTVAGTSPNKIIVLGAVDSFHAGPKYGEGHPGSQYMVVSIPQVEVKN